MNKQRICLTLSENVIETITELAHATGRSKSALLDDMVQSAIPTLQATTAILRKAQHLKIQAHQIIAQDFNEAIADARQLQLSLEAQVLKIDTKINRKLGPKRATVTPITNRGVKIRD